MSPAQIQPPWPPPHHSPIPEGAKPAPRSRSSSSEERLRTKTEAWLRLTYPNHRIIHELNLDRGTQRLDVAAVSPSEIVIVEIKSDLDVLDRLPAQLSAATAVGDYVWLVAGVSMDSTIMSGAVQIPPNVGVRFEGEENLCGQPVMLRPRRSFDDQTPVMSLPPGSRRNWTDPRALASLLWVEEWSSALSIAGLPPRGNHRTLCQRAVESFSGTELKSWVCAALRARSFPRADSPIAPAYQIGPLGWKRPVQ